MNGSELALLERGQPSAADTHAQSEWTAQKWVWVKDEAEGFVAANIVEEKGDTMKVKMANNMVVEFNINDTFKMNPPKFEKVEDMAELAYLNEPAVLENLRKRYQSNLIYTYSGLFCVVINPYKRLPIYTTAVVNAYKGKRRQELPPHVYSIADRAFRDMLQDRENQSILITGESGAGKTENTKKVIQYLATIASGSSSGQGTLEKQLLQCNPVLEAFGNAKTIKNDNSSRFGKFIRIEFDGSGVISGGNIETYLLEKSRAVTQGAEERNFHIFYQLLKSATPEEREAYLLDDIENVPYISCPEYSEVDAVDDRNEFKEMKEAMRVVGIDDEAQKSIFKVLGGIMKCGQMKFQDDRSEQAQMHDDSQAAMVCKLFGIPLSDLTRAMLKPRMKVGRDYVTKAQRADQVIASVKAICKAIYERLFFWIVERVNKALDNRRGGSNAFIGILDIAGFEIFKLNSFEQLCINYTNEKLQQFFNNHMFVTEQEEYRKEGIEWTFIDFGLDLQPCIDLIEKPMGILSLMDDECLLLPRSTDATYSEKLEKQHYGQTAKFAKRGGKIKRDIPGFVIEHYASPVEYTLDGWLIKNTDPLNDNITSLLAKSTDDFMTVLFKDYVDGDRAGGRRGGSMRTVGQLYRDQLTSLMTTLRNTAPHFVRCIIPNHEKKPGKVSAPLILDQLRCNGVLEGIRICRKGFPNRVLFQDFKQRYEILAPGAVPRGFADGKKTCEKILETLQIPTDNYRIGNSKIFFRANVLGQLEEMRDEKLTSVIRNLQAHCQGYLARKIYRRMTNHEVAVKVIQRNCRKYLILRTWPWWKLFVRVQPLLKVTQEDNLKRELTDATKKLEENAKKHEELAKECENLNAERCNLKNELDKKENELYTCNDTNDRLNQRLQQLMKDVQELEERMEEDAVKADSVLAEKKKLAGEREELLEELGVTQEKMEKLSNEKTSLEEKLNATQVSLDAEHDSNQKLNKEKAYLEATLTTTQSNLSAVEDKFKALQKSKVKADALLEEYETKIANSEKDRAELSSTKRRLESELAAAREKIEMLEKRIEELEAEVEKKNKEIAELQAALDTEQQRANKIDREKRDLSNQLEYLKEELESEQNTVAKLKKQNVDLDNTVKSLESSMEDTSSAGAIQADMRVKREAELANLQKKYQDLVETSELSSSENKKKYQQQMEEKEGEMELLQKGKSDLEKKYAQVKADLQQVTTKLEGETKGRAELDKKKKSLESVLADTQNRLQDTEKQLEEVLERNAKLQSEVDSIGKKYDERDAACTTSERDRKALLAKIEEITTMFEEETRQKLAIQGKLKNTEQEMYEVREQLVEKDNEMENAGRTISSLKSQADELKMKLETERHGLEEMEMSKKKIMRDLSDLHEELDESNTTKMKLVSTNARLQSDIDDLTNELNTAHNDAQIASKKAKKAESQLNEHKSLVDQAEGDRNAAQGEVARLAGEVYSLKAQNDELNSMVAQLKKEASNLKSEVEELKSSGDRDAQYVANLEKAKRSLDAMLEEQKMEMDELEDDLANCEDAKVRLEVSVQALKTQLERTMQESEEKVEESRKSIMRQLRDMEEQLEEERRSKTSLNSKAKKLEAELLEMQITLDDAEKQKEEAIKQNKKAQQMAKDFQNDSDDAKSQLAAAQNQLRDLEKKTSRMNSDNAQLVAELEKSEKNRKAAELARDENGLELDSLRVQAASLTESKRRLDGELDSLKEEHEELSLEFDDLSDRERKATFELETARHSEAMEKEMVAKLESRIQQLERQANDLRDQVETATTEAEKKLKTKLMPFEHKVSSLTADLDAEIKKNNDLSNKLKRVDRKMKESQRMLEDSEKSAADSKANFDRVSSKIRNITSQTEELDAEVNTLRSKNRRLQSELNEASELSEQLKSQLQSVQSRANRVSRVRRTKLGDDDDAVIGEEDE